MQIYERTIKPSGMDFIFSRVRDGEPVRKVKGKLINTAINRWTFGIMLPCPCGSGALFHDCCGPIVAGESPAPTAEALMRSRYTAFTMGERAHIERTYAPEMRTLGNGSSLNHVLNG